MQSLKREIENLNTDFVIKASQRDAFEKVLKEKKEELLLEQETEKLLVKLAIMFQNIAKEQREFVVSEIQQIGTVALQSIYGEDCNLKLELIHDKKVKCKILVSQGGIEREPENFNGGGIVDIVSLALRIAMLEILELQGPILLDEPGKHVSTDYIEGFSDFIKAMSEKLNRQIIFITHNEYLANSSSNRIKIE